MLGFTEQEKPLGVPLENLFKSLNLKDSQRNFVGVQQCKRLSVVSSGFSLLLWNTILL